VANVGDSLRQLGQVRYWSLTLLNIAQMISDKLSSLHRIDSSVVPACWESGVSVRTWTSGDGVKRTCMASECMVEADLGMFSMFARTGAPTKRGPPQKDKKFFFIFLQHGSEPEILK